VNLDIRSWTVCAAIASAALLVPFQSALTQQTKGNSQPPITLSGSAEANTASDSQHAPSLLPGLRDAPESLIDGELVLRLHAYIWRNFMPLATSQDAAGLAAQAKPRAHKKRLEEAL
jgi:hypothetical protein